MVCRYLDSKTKLKGTLDICYRCHRRNKYANKYEFTYECKKEVLEKMDEEERQELAWEIIEAILVADSQPFDYKETRMLGDCYARVWMYTLTRGHPMKDTYKGYQEVRKCLREAAKSSAPAAGVVAVYEKKDFILPACWLYRKIKL